jgi:2-octaprenylphenol hydroxylase
MKFDIIVVGGGLVGYSFALDLAQKKPNFTIGILEHKEYQMLEHINLDSRIYAISPDNIRYLESLGLEIDQSRVGTIKKMDVFGDQNGNIIFDNKIAKQLFLAKTIEYNNLQNSLYLKLKTIANISLIYDNLKEISYKDNDIVLIGSKDSYISKLVVGADGANSFIRASSQIEIEEINYQERGVVANFECQYHHNNTAYQWFSARGVLAYLPLSNNQISIVWATKEYQKLTSLSDEDFSLEVEAMGAGKLGKLKLITKAQVFPLRLYMLKNIYANKIALIGDAAHTIHPLAGQGVNLGFADAQVLATILSKCESYQVGDSVILRKYNNLRISEIRRMQLTCHALYRLFGLKKPLFKKVRNSGLNFVNLIPAVKKYLINAT